MRVRLLLTLCTAGLLYMIGADASAVPRYESSQFQTQHPLGIGAKDNDWPIFEQSDTTCASNTYHFTGLIPVSEARSLFFCELDKPRSVDIRVSLHVLSTSE